MVIRTSRCKYLKVRRLNCQQVAKGHQNSSNTVGLQSKYPPEKVLLKLSKVIYQVQFYAGWTQVLTESDKKILEPLLAASNKSFILPQTSQHLLEQCVKSVQSLQ